MNSNTILSTEKYLERIKYSGKTPLNYETLSNLVYCHFTSVPYENFDILNNIPLSLKVPDLYDKIVIRNRGGYCFELNTLFNWLLTETGFTTHTYIARFLADETGIPMRRHRVMRVDIDGQHYIADVGVGSEVPVRPLRLEENVETEVRGVLYKFRKDEMYGWVLQYKNSKNEWKDIYGFTEEPQYEIDFVQPDFWCQHSPDSPFRTQNMAAIRTETGKYAIDGNILRIFDLSCGDKTVASREFEPSELPAILEKYFGVIL
ncbi:MAG: arylamine N-acetyltransferase [Oscillospiraceae bacterium]|nr:arylamine N-acetyltransferase [Oscillospiraceae bacterium]